MADQKLQVNMLGEFSISCGDKIIRDKDARSKKVWNILERLIFYRDREIQKEELIEILWANERLDDPGNALKTLLYRVRSTIEELGFDSGKSVVRYKHGAYSWNRDIEMLVDTEEFERYIRLAESSDGEHDKLELLLKALSFYKGDFLPASASELWVIPISSYFHSLYVNLLGNTIPLLSEAARYEEIVELCRHAVDIDPYDEHLHYIMIRSLIAAGSGQAAYQHYIYVTDLFYSKFGITPSDEFTSLYREIADNDNNIVELDLNRIKMSLDSSVKYKGAFFCELEIFKDFYRLETRSAARTGLVTYLGLLTLGEESPNIRRKTVNAAMERLKETIGVSLRNSDVYTRYSVSQYLILLYSSTYEKGSQVMRRIISNYNRGAPKNRLALSYGLLPVQSDSQYLKIISKPPSFTAIQL
jgi:DNA-binding SARP family transcriptional activator